MNAAPALTDKVDWTMRHCTVSSVVGPTETPLSPPLADFLLDHPDLSAYIARKHGIAPYRIAVRSPNEFWADDGDGTAGVMDLTQSGAARRIYYGEGTHKSRMFPIILADAVIVMDMSPKHRGNCSDRLNSTFSVYVKLRNPALSVMVKAFRVFLKKTIIQKFSRAFLVADRVGRLLVKAPDSVMADIKEYPLSDQERERALRLISSVKAEPASCL